MAQLSGNPETRCLSAVQEAKLQARAARREPEDREPGTVRRGWQHVAASVVEERAREVMFTRASDQVKAFIRSRGSQGRSSLHSNANLQGNDHPLPTCFVFSCFADFISSFPSQVVHADVAVSSTPLATIVLPERLGVA